MAPRRGAPPETLGRSDGTPGQRFPLAAPPGRWPPTVAGTLEVRVDEDDQIWTEVPHFAESGPDDRHYRIDARRRRGPARAGGAARPTARSGTTAPSRRGVRRWCITSYRSGGGRRGNVTAGQVRVLKTSVPYVARVENRVAAVGGADAETLDDAKVRGPMLLRSRGRAVTAEDFVQLAQDVAPEAARVHCARQPRGRPGRGRARARRTPRRRRRRGPDPPRRPASGGGHAAADQPRRWTRAAWSAPGCWSRRRRYVGLTVVVDVQRPGTLRRRTRCTTTCCVPLRPARPAHRRPGRHRLAVRPVGAVPRGACGAGPDPRRRHGPGGLGDAVPGRRRHRPARELRCSGSTCRRPGSCSPTSTRCGCADAGGHRRARQPTPAGAGRCPGLYQERRVHRDASCGALDEVLAPVLSTLDNLPAYLDVATTPDDLLPWLAAWLGHVARPRPGDGPATRGAAAGQPAARAPGHQARDRARGRGGLRGARRRSRRPEPSDWSLDDDAALPGEPFQAFVVQVSAPAGQVVDEQATRRAGLLHEARARRAPGRGTPERA